MRAHVSRWAVFAAVAWIAAHAAPAARAEGWTTHQGNQEHSGYVPVQIAPGGLRELWSVTLSDHRLNRVAAVDGRVFVTLDIFFEDIDQLFALDAATGAVLWAKGFGPVYAVDPPAVANGILYVKTGEGAQQPPPLLRAFDSATGAFVFQQQFASQGERYYAPVPYGGMIYSEGGTLDGLYAFDAFQPEVVWFDDLASLLGWEPALDDDYVYAYVPDLVVLDRLTGLELTSIPDPNYQGVSPELGVVTVLGALDDIVIVQGGRLVSFDLVQNDIRFEVGPGFLSGDPSVAQGRIYVVDSGALTVRDELTGDYLWGWAAPSSVTDAVLVTDNLAFATTDDAVYAVDLDTHQEVWSAPHAGHLAWSDDVLYVAGADGVLTAYDAPAVLFGDGFESGDAAAWSAVVP